ncbi:MAG TPA: formate dehydrogenase accessory sulfurtransferase FdhD [Acidimicrobiaceae bacterium]|nr:formate dehydrogenase accessory sulfurtransferase FdhD [Acidimicrobiaceae bacterium]
MAARGRTETHLVTRVAVHGADVTAARRPDELVVEEPLTIQLDGVTVSTTMRTPGHDYELAVGFCHGDGLLAGAPVRSVRYCANGAASDSEWNVVTVDTGGTAPTPRPRLGNTTSSCGLCGNDAIDELCARLQPFAVDAPKPSVATMVAVAHSVLSGQGLFQATGAVHAAAAFDADGTVLLTREDVGRHNAVDKVVGRLLLDGRLPAHGLGLFVSGRASFEMVQKAWAGGFAALVAVSAPTALAMHTARRANLLLAGFVRGDQCNVYSPERL